RAFSGGQDSQENHRKYGANLEVDIPVKYLSFFLEDDAGLEHIKQVRLLRWNMEPAMLTGQVKSRLLEVLTALVTRHREAISKVTNEISTLVLKVDLNCAKCYNKMRKTLCQFHYGEFFFIEIHSQTIDKKHGTITITGHFDPQTFSKKLNSNEGKVIKGIEIKQNAKKEEEKPKPKQADAKPDKPKQADAKPDKPQEVKAAEKPKKAEEAKSDPPKLAFSLAFFCLLRRIQKVGDTVKKINIRTIKLLLWGIILQGGYSHAPDDLSYGIDMKQIHWCGILQNSLFYLQRIALVYFIIALIETFTTNVRPTVLKSGHFSIFSAYRWQWLGGFIAFLIYMITTFSLMLNVQKGRTWSCKSRPPLRRSVWPIPDRSYACNGPKPVQFKTGLFLYEIDHKQMPLKFRTQLEALRAIMLARIVLIRLISPDEFANRRHLRSFWLLPSKGSDVSSSVVNEDLKDETSLKDPPRSFIFAKPNQRRRVCHDTKSIVTLNRMGIENLAKMGSRKEPWIVVLYAPWCQFCTAMEGSFVEFADKLKESGVKVGKFRADSE
ncbi:hypothetical protein IFM89_003900, partial [Coptis chinensis]